jgi:predicted RNase H-like HicB family nuclease
MTTYTAVAARSGDWWAISVPELKGVHSQARRLDQVEANAREAIALFLEVPANSFKVQVKPVVPEEVERALAEREAAREADRRAEAATWNAVKFLLRRGFTVRDTGRMLGLSPQRISQISTEQHAKTR